MGQPGGLLLVAAVAAALASTACSARAWRSGGLTAARAGRGLLIGAAGLAGAATIALGWALVTDDFSLVYVADHSRRFAASAYRLAGLWGGMAGSLLFWTALLAIVAAIGAWRAAALGAIGVRAQTVLAAVVGAFALTTLVLANPFELLTIPAVDGGGLTPILEHPAMLYHPPLLYLGLVTLAVPFALTVGLLLGPFDADATARARAMATRSVLVSWTLLALGMVAGANWAYVEVGWGGYWAWDPIENTALVPWLTGTAYLHARRIDRRSPTGAEPGRCAADALALLAFVLAALGVVLTRSGAASSVHAFAQAVAVGRALTALALLLAVVGVVAFARGGRGAPRPRRLADASWLERALAAQVGLVLVAVALVLVGMLAPIVRTWFGEADSSVEGSYYALVTAPLAVSLALLTIVGPRQSSVRGEPAPLLDSWSVAAMATAFAAALVVGALHGEDPERSGAVVLAGIAAAAVVSAVDLGWRAWRRHRSVAGHVAHLGISLLLLGVAGSTAATVTTVPLSPGVEVDADGMRLRTSGATTEPGPPPRVLVPVEITRGGQTQTLVPSIDGYPERGAVLSETALWSTPLEDVQLTLRRADDAGGAVLDVRRRPLAMLVWWGGAVLVVAGVVALVEHRRRGAARAPEAIGAVTVGS